MQKHPSLSDGVQFFIAASKYQNGVYQRGRVMFDQNTQEPIEPPRFANFVSDNKWQAPDWDLSNYPDLEIYRYTIFRGWAAGGWNGLWYVTSSDVPSWHKYTGRTAMRHAVCTRICSGQVTTLVHHIV